MIDLSSLSHYTYTAHGTGDDPRLGGLIEGYSETAWRDAEYVILGVPTHEGVIRNSGRPGAAQAPDAIRHWLERLTPAANLRTAVAAPRVLDLGNVVNTALEEMLDVTADIVTRCVEAGKRVIALGGGHEVSYGLIKGFSKGVGAKPSVANIDAHLDVRERKAGLHHSGSSFRLLVEQGFIDPTRFWEIGTQPFVASRDHLAWLDHVGSKVCPFNEGDLEDIVTEWISAGGGPRYLTFDMDSVRAADAPGVSAPSPIGYTAESAVRIAALAHREKSIQMMDIVEVNPSFDRDGITARLAARMIASFIFG